MVIVSCRKLSILQTRKWINHTFVLVVPYILLFVLGINKTIFFVFYKVYDLNQVIQTKISILPKFFVQFFKVFILTLYVGKTWEGTAQ